jgi:hypothetical protein
MSVSIFEAGNWYNALKALWGSDDAVLESINPGFLVDTSGTLFYVTPMQDTILVGNVTIR